jgi:hypothetical protein
MITRAVLAVIVAITVGLVCMYLLGPILVSLGAPIAVIVGDFFVRFGWTLGILAGLWYFFSGSAWPSRRSR